MKNRLSALIKKTLSPAARQIRKDNRSLYYICVIDCILNQNTRDSGAATLPAFNWDVIQLCNQYHVGILQMPCPEINFLGFSRNRASGVSIREAMNTDRGRNSCRKLSLDIADRIENLNSQGATLLAVLGGNPESPGCAVHFDQNEQKASSGIFMMELKKVLEQRDIKVPYRGIRDFDTKLMAEDIRWLEQLFKNKC
jgi:predicted secreted protein